MPIWGINLTYLLILFIVHSLWSLNILNALFHERTEQKNCTVWSGLAVLGLVTITKCEHADINFCSDLQSYLWLQTNKCMKVFSRLCWVILHWLWKNNSDVCNHPLQEGRDNLNILTTNIQETMIMSYTHDVGSDMMTENIPWSSDHCATAFFQMYGGDNGGAFSFCYQPSLFFHQSQLVEEAALQLMKCWESLSLCCVY